MSTRLNFTKAALDKLPLPSPGQRATYRDVKTLGLQLRVSNNGIRTFSLFRRIRNGNPERITLGRYPEVSVEQARRKAAELNGEIANHENPAELRRALRQDLTFGELFARYLEEHAKPSKKTWTQDKERYELHVKKALGSKKLATISREDVKRLHLTLTSSGKSTAANRILALISSVFGWATRNEIADHNPAQGIRRNAEKSRDRFLQTEELPAFFGSLAQEPNETFRDYFWLLLLTGVRRANVLAMRWDEISFENKTWRIPETKNGTPQYVSLEDPQNLIVSILRRRKAQAESEWVFPGPGRTGHIVEPRKPWHRLLRQAGLTNLWIHDLRRTLGSWMAGTGASMPIIGKQLNHKSVAATQIYSRLQVDPVNAARSKAVKAILNAGGVTNKGKVISLRPNFTKAHSGR